MHSASPVISKRNVVKFVPSPADRVATCIVGSRSKVVISPAYSNDVRLSHLASRFSPVNLNADITEYLVTGLQKVTYASYTQYDTQGYLYICFLARQLSKTATENEWRQHADHSAFASALLKRKRRLILATSRLRISILSLAMTSNAATSSPYSDPTYMLVSTPSLNGDESVETAKRQ